MQVTLKGVSTDTAVLHSRAGQIPTSGTSGESFTTGKAHQRLGVTLQSDSNAQQRLTQIDLVRTGLNLSGQAKVAPNMVPQAKIFTPQTLAQHVTSIKSGVFFLLFFLLKLKPYI